MGRCTEDGPRIGQSRTGKSLEGLLLNSSFAAFSDYLIDRGPVPSPLTFYDITLLYFPCGTFHSLNPSYFSLPVIVIYVGLGCKFL